jgi:hypothetical protein
MGASVIRTSFSERAVLRVERDPDPHPEAADRARPDLALAAEQADPLTDPDMAEPASHGSVFRAAIVEHLELDRLTEVTQR